MFSTCHLFYRGKKYSWIFILDTETCLITQEVSCKNDILSKPSITIFGSADKSFSFYLNDRYIDSTIFLFSVLIIGKYVQYQQRGNVDPLSFTYIFSLQYNPKQFVAVQFMTGPQSIEIMMLLRFSGSEFQFNSITIHVLQT